LGATGIKEFEVGFEVILMIEGANLRCNGINRGSKMDWTTLWV